MGCARFGPNLLVPSFHQVGTGPNLVDLMVPESFALDPVFWLGRHLRVQTRKSACNAKSGGNWTMGGAFCGIVLCWSRCGWKRCGWKPGSISCPFWSENWNLGWARFWLKWNDARKMTEPYRFKRVIPSKTVSLATRLSIATWFPQKKYSQPFSMSKIRTWKRIW